MLDLTKARWRKSTYSGDNGGACVEIATNVSGIVAVRDSKDRAGGVLAFPAMTWAAFTRTLR
ncbi:DUF397 domain-containing protein [Micromonospora sp. NPDC050187]|uniref:DUF397 domain-containing protein n=1 Tax=Micromonospora sp. NPDC050187 TaxID=3364277 RepID=UPI00379BF589